jgi:hypothetical protein
MYQSALWLHSLLRWAVLLTGLVAWFRAIGGSVARRAWTAQDELWGIVFIMALDLQLLVGLVLYIFLSPITKIAFQNFGAAMRIDTTRFFAVEHVTAMVIAIALAHIGRVRVRRTGDDARRHRLVMIFFGLSLVIMVASIPWPFLPPPFVSRPWFPK